MARIREFVLDDYDTILALWKNAGPVIGIGRSDGLEAVTP